MTRVEGGSRIEVYSHKPHHSQPDHFYCITSTDLHPVPASTCRHVNVTQILVNNRTGAWELVVYERGNRPEITTLVYLNRDWINTLSN